MEKNFEYYLEMALQGEYAKRYKKSNNDKSEYDDIKDKETYQKSVAKEIEKELREIDTDIFVIWDDEREFPFSIYAKDVVRKVEKRDKELAKDIKEHIKKIMEPYEGEIACDIWDKLPPASEDHVYHDE